MNSFDVIVVGAGPSGLLAAGRAAELGGGGGTKDFYYKDSEFHYVKFNKDIARKVTNKKKSWSLFLIIKMK